MRLISIGVTYLWHIEFGKQIHVENSEELVAEPIFCNQNILVGNIYKNKIKIKTVDKDVCHIKHLCHLKVLKKNSELRQITLHILDVCKL